LYNQDKGACRYASCSGGVGMKSNKNQRFQKGTDDASLTTVLKLNQLLEQVFDSVPESVGFLTSADVWSLMSNLLIFARFHLKEPHFSRRQANADLIVETQYDSKSKNAGMVTSRKKRSGIKPIWLEEEPESVDFLDLIYEVVSELKNSPEQFSKILKKFQENFLTADSASEKQKSFSVTLSKRRATIGYYARQYAKRKARRIPRSSLLQNKSSK
jgi:hypothetical protein